MFSFLENDSVLDLLNINVTYRYVSLHTLIKIDLAKTVSYNKDFLDRCKVNSRYNGHDRDPGFCNREAGLFAVRHCCYHFSSDDPLRFSQLLQRGRCCRLCF